MIKKKQNGECNVRNFRWFLFGISPLVPAFKVLVFTSDFKFWNGCKWLLMVDILTQILPPLLTFIALPILQEISICHWWLPFGVSFVLTFNLHLEEWSMDNNMVGKIWVSHQNGCQALNEVKNLEDLMHGKVNPCANASMCHFYQCSIICHPNQKLTIEVAPSFIYHLGTKESNKHAIP